MSKHNLLARICIKMLGKIYQSLLKGPMNKESIDRYWCLTAFRFCQMLCQVWLLELSSSSIDSFLFATGVQRFVNFDALIQNDNRNISRLSHQVARGRLRLYETYHSARSWPDCKMLNRLFVFVTFQEVVTSNTKR